MSLCVVFDIDETILHSIFEPNAKDEFNILKGEKEYYKNLKIYEPSDSSFICVFRNGFREFLEYVKSKNGDIVLAIWTYGNANYARTIVKAIDNVFGFKGPYAFVYSEAEIRDDLVQGMMEKDLRRVYESTPFTMANTILVDNRPANIYHDANYQNGFIVESFLPMHKSYNIDKERLFKDLQLICDRFLEKQATHSYRESVFSQKNVENMELGEYMRHFIVHNNAKPIMSMESIDYDENFFLNKMGGKLAKKKSRKNKTRSKYNGNRRSRRMHST